MTKNKMLDIVVNTIRFMALGLVILPLLLIVMDVDKGPTDKEESEADAYILTKPGTVTAQWKYQQMRMSKCSWCSRTVDMNRHHIVPQAANPALRDVRENLVVLCRDCHFVLGHRCNWKQYNPDVLYICTHFTNCVRSADTRKYVDGVDTPNTNVSERFYPPVVYENPDGRAILHVTNDVPDKQRAALERILKWTNSVPFHPSDVR